MSVCVGKKAGMSRFFDESSRSFYPVTLVVLDDFSFLGSQDAKNNPDLALFGYDVVSEKKLTKPVRVSQEKRGSSELFRHLKSVSIGEDEIRDLSIGSKISNDQMFSEGDLVDISGISTGKGFAGGMKRHGFRGLEATHGVSVSHRSHGSTGQRQDPGRVFKGKKMAGHMGAKKVTVKNLKIVSKFLNDGKVVLCLKGSVPGFSGSNLFVYTKKEYIFS